MTNATAEAASPVLERPRVAWGEFLRWGFVMVIVAAVLGPIAMVLLAGVNVAPILQGFSFGVGHWVEALSAPDVGSALWNTVTIVAIRGLLGFVIAIPIAWLIARTNMPGRDALEFGFWIAFFMPSLAYIQSWAFLLEGYNGLINQWLRSIPLLSSINFDVYSYWGIIWVHLLSHNVSILVVMLVLAFRNMDSSLEEVARISGASKWKTIADVILPLSRPMIAMLVILAIIKGMQSYEVEAILGQPAGIDVYSTLVVRMLTDEPPRIAQGAVLSTVILVTLLPLIVLQRLYVGGRQYTTISSKMRMTQIDLGRVKRWAAFGVVSLLVAMQTVVPFFSLIAGSLMVRWGYFSIPSPWTLDKWKMVLSNEQFLVSLLNTLSLGILAGAGAALICFAVAYILVRSPFWGRGVLEFVSWLPWAIPGVLLSLGLVAMVMGIPVLRPLYGTLFILAVAVILFRFPLSVHLLKTGLMQINRELEEASTICGSDKVTTQWRITVPILMPMLIAVGLMTFVTAVNEVSGVVLLASADLRTLSLLSLDYIMGGRPQKEAAAVVTIVMLVLCVGVALIARAFGIRLGAASDK